MLVTDQPEGLPSTNALDGVKDPDAEEYVQPEELRLGSSTLMVMPKPPKTGDYVDVAMRLQIKRTAEDQTTPDSAMQYPRYAEIVVAWPLNEPMPAVQSKAEKKAKAEDDAVNGVPLVDDDQPSLYGDDDDEPGELPDEPEPGDDDAEPAPAALSVVPPAFSDGDQ